MYRRQDNDDIWHERARVIDHLDRLIAVVVGLAMFEAMRRGYRCFQYGNAAGVVQFWALLATVPPAYMALERSLGLQFRRSGGRQPRADEMLWALAAVLLTLVFVVGLALSLPDPQDEELRELLARLGQGIGPTPEDGTAQRLWFLALMGLFFAYEAVVMLVALDGLRARLAEALAGWGDDQAAAAIRALRRIHLRWAGIDALAASLCALAWLYEVYREPAWEGFASYQLGFLLAVAVGRGIAQVWLGWRFLFPREAA